MTTQAELQAEDLGRELVAALLASRHSLQSIAAWRQNAAWMFHRCGQTWHELLLLNEIMHDFASGNAPPDPRPAFETMLSELTNGECAQTMARRCYELALALSPQHAETIYSLATLDCRIGDVGQALSRWRRVVELPPAAGTPAHAHTADNARWNCGEILEKEGRLHEAGRLFHAALAGIGSVGPHQRRGPRLLQRLLEVDKAADQFDAVMTYSHRYAPEFVALTQGEGLMPPQRSQLYPADPFRAAVIGEVDSEHHLVYFAGVFFRWPVNVPVPDGGRELIAQAGQFVRPKRRLMFFTHGKAVCAPRADYWSC